jgi:hypothetical protein
LRQPIYETASTVTGADQAKRLRRDMPLVKARAIVDHVHRDEESPDLRQSAPNWDAGSGSYLGVHMG